MLSRETSYLHFRPVTVIFYLLGDCDFCLEMYMMRSCAKPENRANLDFEQFEKVAASTRNPVEGMIGMLKFRFPILKNENGFCT